MTVVNELNKLAEKITGTNPKATTDKKALDYIADYYAEEDLKPITNAQAIKNITENYSGGGTTPTGTISITENGTYDVTDKASAEVNVSGPSYSVKSGTQSLSGYYDLANQVVGQLNRCLIDDTKIDYLFRLYTGEKIPALYSTKTITSAQYAFSTCMAKEIDISGIQWANVNINCADMFANCNNCNILDISSLEFRNITITGEMFKDVGSWAEVSSGGYAEGIPYVYVKDEYAQDKVISWHNAQDEYDVTWTTANVVIKS